MNLKKIAVLFTLCCASSLWAGDRLAQNFQNPPTDSRARVWWHWMGGQVSSNGISHDLEALKSAGLGGATIMVMPDSVSGYDAYVISNSPAGVKVLSPQWFDLVAFAASEAGRLGLHLGIHNCAGYSASGGPWITPEKSMQRLVWSVQYVSGVQGQKIILAQPDIRAQEDIFYRGNALDPKGWYRDIAVVAVPQVESLTAENTIVLNGKLSPDGTLDWQPPAGEWTVYRFGHTTTGKGNHPSPLEARGFETDKFAAEVTRFHFDQFMQPIISRLDANGKMALESVLVDSYEAGNQTWSENFTAEFQKRRGYDPFPWLAALAGEARFKNGNASRFLYDFNRTVAELFAQNYYGALCDATHRAGMTFEVEPYSGPFRTADVAAIPDLPMDEFWLGGGLGEKVTLPAELAGKKIIGAEAFTAAPDSPSACWAVTPWMLLPTAHAVYLHGINQFYLHTYPLQPWGDDVKPGVTMGWWGSQFSRNLTWWDQSRAFFDYLARCHFLLRQGVRVRDTVNLDAFPEEVFLRDLKVREGRLVLPDGNSFAALVLSDTNVMRLDYARKLEELVRAGAVIAGPKPDTAPGLENYPAAETEVRRIAAELWGECDGKTNTHQAFGEGRVFWGESVELALNLAPDFITLAGSGAKVQALHRREGQTDIYFVANLDGGPVEFTGSFRVSGKLPEIFDPLDGSVRPAAAWQSVDGWTQVPLRLENSGAVFVVFRNQVRGNGQGLNHPAQKNETLAALDGEWRVTFPPRLGAPESITLPNLVSLSRHELIGVKYFSGAATYVKDFNWNQLVSYAGNTKVWLDLGDVHDVATVTLNDKNLGTVWRPPFRVDATAALRSGENWLKVRVANTWANRLVGDEQEPDDCSWGGLEIWPPNSSTGKKVGQHLAMYPAWFPNISLRPSASRFTFSTWKKYAKDSPLPEAGLCGPVNLTRQ